MQDVHQLKYQGADVAVLLMPLSLLADLQLRVPTGTIKNADDTVSHSGLRLT